MAGTGVPLQNLRGTVAESRQKEPRSCYRWWSHGPVAGGVARVAHAPDHGGSMPLPYNGPSSETTSSRKRRAWPWAFKTLRTTSDLAKMSTMAEARFPPKRHSTYTRHSGGARFIGLGTATIILNVAMMSTSPDRGKHIHCTSVERSTAPRRGLRNRRLRPKPPRTYCRKVLIPNRGTKKKHL